VKKKKRKPTKAQRTAAAKVIRYYLDKAIKLACTVNQQRPDEWNMALSIVNELLEEDDPEVTFSRYLEEFEAGRSNAK
jgi:hypothetical protein